MKIVFIVTVLLTLCLVAFAQSVVANSGSGKIQSVGGDFGKAWISNLQAQNPKPDAQTNNSTLWGWGSLPKGKVMTGGKLVDAPNATWLYNTTNWMGDNYVDPYARSYIDPNTGQPVYRNYQVFPPTATNSPTTNNQQNPQLPEILQPRNPMGTGM